jgi:hypothetical protein
MKEESRNNSAQILGCVDRLERKFVEGELMSLLVTSRILNPLFFRQQSIDKRSPERSRYVLLMTTSQFRA